MKKIKKKRVRILWVTAEFLHYFSPSRFGMNQFLAIVDWLSEISHRERRALIGQIDLREKWMDLWLSHPFSVSENKNEILENLEKIWTLRDQLKLCQRSRLRTTPSGESSLPWLTLRIPELIFNESYYQFGFCFKGYKIISIKTFLNIIYNTFWCFENHDVRVCENF